MNRALAVLVLMIGVGLFVTMPPIEARVEQTTVTEGAEALAEYACEGEGGVLEFDWEEAGRGSYEVSTTCDSGLVITGLHFNCPMCEPV